MNKKVFKTIYYVAFTLLSTTTIAQSYKTKPYKEYYPDGNLFISGELQSRFKLIESDDEDDNT